ncbi:MAG: hypothetical protein OZSIB_2034 [Candidatus Ozemobacter sibiricus]|jgi:hypothetical protein|uniref:Uncharacterized protein n=1 Tax=Candidatus Ozemobacter sibiricus TaxID=2268124 RepID=A0A367ZIF6_9BACT|nr:MAG: hypothetical protein OZSIB_2034 [Candidatus Ozemobacter sibiricus]
MRITIQIVLIALLLLASHTLFPSQVQAQSINLRNLLRSPEMNLTLSGGLPAGFRGSEAGSGGLNILEDAKYALSEHSVLYEETPTNLGEDAKDRKFTSPPTINWTTRQVDANGNSTVVRNDNNNLATNEGTFPEPGEYMITNTGSRQISGGSQETSGSGSGSSTPGGSQSGSGASGQSGSGAQTPGSGSEGGSGQRLTSTQTIGVIAHDVTSPNLWVVFQEGAGQGQIAESEAALQDELGRQMEASKGEFSGDQLSGPLAQASLLSIYESPRNAHPTKKTAAVAVAGPVFDATGKPVSQVAGKVKATVLDEAAQTRLVTVGEEVLKGIFVRRNVPFLVAGQIQDNGKYKRDSAVCRIENKETGEVIEKVDGAYLFRVPNYPRSEYADQPVYQFVMEGKDDAGNQTVVKVPLYVVNTAVSYEGGRNE